MGPESKRGLFALTAMNPLGHPKPLQENLLQNKLLEQDLQDLCSGAEGVRRVWWRSFGFTAGWREDGFTVAADPESVLQLARRYRQGAIYRYQPAPPCAMGMGVFLRTTVPVCMPDTGADVLILPCSRPPFDNADDIR